jgi:aminopeptidase 2
MNLCIHPPKEPPFPFFRLGADAGSVWDEIESRLGQLRVAWIFEPNDVRDGLTAFTRDLAGPKAKSLGWNIATDEDHIRRRFKALLFMTAGIADDPEIVSAAKDMFARWVAGEKAAIHPDLRSAVFGIALKNGGKAEV